MLPGTDSQAAAASSGAREAPVAITDLKQAPPARSLAETRVKMPPATERRVLDSSPLPELGTPGREWGPKPGPAPRP